LSTPKVSKPWQELQLNLWLFEMRDDGGQGREAARLAGDREFPLHQVAQRGHPDSVRLRFLSITPEQLPRSR